MLVGIEGRIERKEPTLLHINTNGLIYEVHVSINTSNSIVEDRVKLLLTQIIREDTNLLFGFLDKNEKKMFDTLIKINGVGTKVAMAVCSTFSPATFAEIIANRNSNMLKKVVGIGVKSANRILVELSDFTIDSSKNIDSSVRDAILALESLGFKSEHIQSAIKGASGDTASIVKYALKNLQKL